MTMPVRYIAPFYQMTAFLKAIKTTVHTLMFWRKQETLRQSQSKAQRNYFEEQAEQSEIVINKLQLLIILSVLCGCTLIASIILMYNPLAELKTPYFQSWRDKNIYSSCLPCLFTPMRLSQQCAEWEDNNILAFSCESMY